MILLRQEISLKCVMGNHIISQFLAKKIKKKTKLLPSYEKI